MSEPAANSAFAAAIAHEERNRLLAYVPRRFVEIPLRRGIAFPFPIVSLRWRHVLELLRSGNAFVTAAPAQPGDIAELLWLLHPHHPGNRSLLPSDASRLTLPLYAWLSRVVVEIACAQVALGAAEVALRSLIRDAFQDREHSGAPVGEEPSALEPTLTQLDTVSERFARAGYTVDQVLAAPVAWTLQVIRAEGLRDPERRDNFVPPSARLLRLEPEPATPPSP